MNIRQSSAHTRWWTDPEEIADLLRWLRARGDIDSLDEAIRIVEEAWSWDDQYRRMRVEQVAR